MGSNRSERSSWPRRVVQSSLLVGGLAVLAACGSPGEDPPVAALGPAGAAPADVEPPVAARPVDGEGAGVDAVALDACDLARDPLVMADVDRWADYIPALQAVVPAEVDVSATLASLTPDTPATPLLVTRLDQLWDLVDAYCQQDPLVEQCRSLIAIGLADAVGWAARADDPAEVEAAFALARDNWSDLRDRVAGEDLRWAIDANLRFLDDAGGALAAVGWGPGRLDVLEPFADQMIALGEPDVIDPLYELEAKCGFR